MKMKIDKLTKFIEKNFGDSPKKREYLQAALMLGSSEEDKVNEAKEKMEEMKKELGKDKAKSWLGDVAANIIGELFNF